MESHIFFTVVRETSSFWASAGLVAVRLEIEQINKRCSAALK
jgi:hypothetical protein